MTHIPPGQPPGWIPDIGVKLVTSNGREIDSPYWGRWAAEELSWSEWQSICETSKMNRKLCLKYWKWAGYKDKPPRWASVALKAEDVMRKFPPNERPPIRH